MIKESVVFIVKAACLAYVLSFWVLPILCGSLLLSLLKHTVLMGLNCFKDIVDDRRREQHSSQKNSQPISTQPRSAQQEMNEKTNSRKLPKRNPGELKNQGTRGQMTSSQEESSTMKQSGKHSRNARKLGSTSSDQSTRKNQVQGKTPHDVVWNSNKNKKRNKNSEDEPWAKCNPEDTKTGTGSESVKRFKPSPKSEQQVSNKKILDEFENGLRDNYEGLFQKGKPHTFWFDVRSQRNSGDVDERLCTLDELFPSKPTSWRMLVYGLPRYGKSQLCQDLTSIWVSQSSERARDEYQSFKSFRFWIFLQLAEEGIDNLEKTILGRCYNLMSQETKKDEFRNAWKSQMRSTMIVLDGFDDLNQKQKLHVKSFIRGNEFFDAASFLLTSRPNNDTELGKLFNIQADICGLTEMTLTRWIANAEVSGNQLCKIKELIGISPFYVQAICKVLSETEKPQTLYELVHKMMQLILQNVAINKKEIFDFGRFLAERLKYRQFIFKQSDLPEHLQEKCEVFKECNILNECSARNDGSVHFVVSHMIFMLYFCVRYLQEKIKRLSTFDERLSFSKQYLTFKDGSEEYYTSFEGTSNKYMVGLVPEIVFTVNTGLFVMAADVEDPNLRSVFETQRLLLRADNKKQLGMFGFAEFEESQLQESFMDLLSMLDFSDLTTERSYFMQNKSALRFMKLSASNEEDRLVMFGVASSNEAGQIQDIILEFSDSDIQQLSSFLQKLVELFYGPCQLDTNEGNQEFLSSLALSALRCSRNCYTRITQFPKDIPPFDYTAWEIVSSSENKQRANLVNTVFNSTVTPVSRKYESEYCYNLIEDLNTIAKVGTFYGERYELHLSICA